MRLQVVDFQKRLDATTGLFTSRNIPACIDLVGDANQPKEAASRLRTLPFTPSYSSSSFQPPSLRLLLPPVPCLSQFNEGSPPRKLRKRTLVFDGRAREKAATKAGLGLYSTTTGAPDVGLRLFYDVPYGVVVPDLNTRDESSQRGCCWGRLNSYRWWLLENRASNR